MADPGRYALERLAPQRALVLDLLWAAARQHSIHSLLEVDIDDARRAFSARQAESGAAPSLTAWVACCVARAARDHREVRSVRVGRRLVVHNKVPLGVVLERQIGDTLMPMPLVLEDPDQQGLNEVHRQLRETQGRSLADAGEVARLGRFAALPAPFRRALLWMSGRSVRLAARYRTPIIVTSLGPVLGRGAAWGIPLSAVTLSVTIGGIVQRPVRAGDALAWHDHLCLTLSFDHDVVDGAPAARFAARLRELMAEPPS